MPSWNGWLFCDFRHSDPLAYRILKLDDNMPVSRRWFYCVPASGEPVKIVQSKQFKLDSLLGKNLCSAAGRNCMRGFRKRAAVRLSIFTQVSEIGHGFAKFAQA